MENKAARRSIVHPQEYAEEIHQQPVIVSAISNTLEKITLGPIPELVKRQFILVMREPRLVVDTWATAIYPSQSALI